MVFPTSSLTRTFRIVAQQFSLSCGGLESGESESVFHAEATLLDELVAYVPACVTLTPIVHGPQTATVTGESGSPTWTDALGRVKVRFHWDRHSSGDTNSSCWVRVSQSSASAGWGAMALPHVGDEVVVSFLEGDPDRPLVTGRVYNATHMPPLSLPGTESRSILRDRAGNELLFDATSGAERISIHCPNQGTLQQLDPSGIRTSTRGDVSVRAAGSVSSCTGGDQTSWNVGNLIQVTRGVSASAKMGVSASVTLGTDISAFAGLKIGFSAGVHIDCSANSKFSVSKDHSWKYSGGSAYTRSKDDIVVDSESDLYLTGGSKDEALIRCTKSELVLSFHKSNGERDVSKIDAWAAKVGVGAAAFIGACSAGVGTWYEFDETQRALDREEGGCEQTESAFDEVFGHMAQDATLLSGLALGVGAAAWAGKPKGKPPLPDHGTAAPSGLQIKDNYTKLWANGNDGNTFLELQKPGVVKLNAKKHLRVESENELVLSGKKGVTVRDKIEFKKGIKHRNLKVD